jgi:hypothetical protein
MPHFRILLLVLAALFAVSAEAAIYKCVDAEGRVTFTDARCKGGKRMDLPGGGGASISGGRSSGVGGGKSAARSPSPVDFPRIDSATQKRRDDIRRQVLEDEIASETRAIAAARQQFVQGQKPLPGERAGDAAHSGRVAALREAVARHERNVAAIRRELSKLR